MTSAGNRTGIVAAAMVLVASVVSCGGGSGGNGSSSPNTIGGSINTTNFVVPAGETRTVTSDLLVNASGSIQINGTLIVNPGVNVALVASGPVTISGSIQPTVSKAARRGAAPLRGAQSAGSKSVTRGDPAGPYVIVCGNGVKIPRNFSDNKTFGISAAPGCNIYGGALASAYTATIISANFAPNAINGRGHVAGTSTDTGHAFFWNGSGTPVDLGTGTATALNDNDVVVGYDGNLPFVWDPKNLRHALALPAGTQSAQALGINANGAIVGGVIASGGPVLSTNYAVEWPSATAAPVPLAGPGGDYFMNQNTGQIATAINDNGVIAGTQGVQLGPVYALRWANSGSSPDVIGYAVGNYTICASTCINSAGDIYGYGSFNGNTATYHALVCKAGSTTPTDISPGFAQKTAVLAVNSAGTPVGFTGERANACVFSGGAVISLSSRVTNLAGISLVQATGINGCGRIIATDLTNAYVLSPN